MSTDTKANIALILSLILFLFHAVFLAKPCLFDFKKYLLC